MDTSKCGALIPGRVAREQLAAGGQEILRTLENTVVEDSPDFNDLPDELVLLVFSFIEDPMTLMDALPLICRRWRELSREPRAWASVRLDVDAGLPQELPPLPLKEACRALMRAPALASLTVDCQCWRLDLPFFHETRARCIVDKALRMSHAKVRNLHLHCLCPSIAQFIQHNLGNHTRALRITEIGQEEGSYSTKAILEELQQLPCLQTLQLHFYMVKNHAYSRNPSICLKSLRSLEIEVHVSDQASPDELVADLIRGAAASLRHLHVFWYDWDKVLPSIVAESITGCVNLQTISLDMKDASLAVQMPQLRVLHLMLPARWDRDIISLQNVTELLKHYQGKLNSVQSIDVYASVINPLHLDTARMLLVALARAASTARRLRVVLTPDYWAKTCVRDMLHCLPYLQELKIELAEDYISALLPTIAFQHLQEITVEFWRPTMWEEENCRRNLVELFCKEGADSPKVHVRNLWLRSTN